MEKTLRPFSNGKKIKLDQIIGDSDNVERLIDMGFHPGIEIEVINKMVNGGPYILRIQSGFIALREEEVACLKVVGL